MTRRRIPISAFEASLRTWQVPVYALAAASMAGAIMIGGAPPGVRWGVFLIASALVVAARTASAADRLGQASPRRAAAVPRAMRSSERAGRRA